MNGASGKFAKLTLFALALLLVGIKADAQPAPDYAALLAAPDRSDADREADKRRDPLPLLAFADVRPGLKVLDMGAGRGYSTELIARAVARAESFMDRTLPIFRRNPEPHSRLG